jgi:Uri superfamily endonuclease
MKGSYILVLYLSENVNIPIGALGEIDFVKGHYLYIGSAMAKKGSNTLENRIKRHILEPNNKKLFWHIDYLLKNKICLITKIYLIPTIIRLECIISKEILKVSDNYIKDFGSSDCHCISHLYYFKKFQGIIDIAN